MMGGEQSKPDSFNDGGGDKAAMVKMLADIIRKGKQGQRPEDQLIVGPYPSRPPPKPAAGGDEFGFGMLNAGGMMGESGGSSFGGSSSPWDTVFSSLGRAHGAYAGNDPNSPMVPHGRDKGGDEWLVNAGAPAGKAVGSAFGFGSSGELAGQNVGATLADLKNGNIKNLGLDVSANLPPLPGMQREGWKGLLNGATGLPVASLFDLFK